MHDSDMPQGWHTIKSVLLTEIRTAANFHLCCRAANALFHARLVGESCARDGQRTRVEQGLAPAEDSPPTARGDK